MTIAVGGIITTKTGRWIFVVWNVLVLAATVFCVAELSGVMRGKTLLTLGVVGYALVGLGGGAWLGSLSTHDTRS